jgi:hypothetical protein
MQYILILIILCMAGGGYYEYTSMQQQLSDQDGQIQKLQSDNADLKRKLAAAPTAPATTNAADASQTAPGATAPGTSPAPTSPVPGPGWSNVLGTVTTVDGKTYQNCRLLKVKPTGIVVNNADGITEIGFMVMQPALQQRFGYDPKAGANLPDDVVQADEGLRQASKD